MRKFLILVVLFLLPGSFLFAVQQSVGTSPAFTTISANNTSGLSLEDDGGNLGIFIEDGGKVGIGTTNPSVKLEITGDQQKLQLTDDGGVNLNMGAENTICLIKSNGGDLRIGTGSNTNSITIDNAAAGNVGINNTAPGATLDVDGTGNFTGALTAASYADNTPYPKTKKEAYDAVMSMEGVDGELDDKKLDKYIRVKKTKQKYNPVTKSTDTIITYHRNISTSLSAQNEVLKDQIQINKDQDEIIEDLIARIEQLEQ